MSEPLDVGELTGTDAASRSGSRTLFSEENTSAARGVAGSVARLQAQRASEAFAELEDRYRRTREPLEVSFRQLVGPIPADDMTHSLYPYPARLLRQIPRFFLHCEQVLKPGEVVLDPFCGSGTVLVEARSAGVPAWGVDINPFACLLSRVKTSLIDREEMLAGIDETLSQAKRSRSQQLPDVVNVDLWFSRPVQSSLGRLLRAIRSLETGDDVREFLLLCLARTAESCSLRDSRIPVPVRRSDWEAIARQQTTDTVWSTFSALGRAVADRICRLHSREDEVTTVVTEGCASGVADRYEKGRPLALPSRPKVIITSPPYGAAQKYVRSTSLSLGWTGLAQVEQLAKLEEQSIGREHLLKDELGDLDVPMPQLRRAIRDIERYDPRRAAIYAHYFRAMDEAFESMTAVLGVGGLVVLVTGSNVVAGAEFPTNRYLRDLALTHGMTQRLELVDVIRGRTLLTKRANVGAPLRAETVHVLQVSA